jgi:putative flippase GtrA
MTKDSLSTSLLQKPFVRFAGVGLTSTVLDIALLNVFAHFGVAVPVATAVGFLAGATNGYFLNSAFVFQADRTAARYIKYLVVSIGGFIITEFIVNYLHGSFGLNKAKLVAVVLVFFWNYGLSKVWAFK